MAERRMFAKTIIDSDAFLEMPASTQNLYFHLSMRADDDGFLNNPKKISRMIGASEDDLKVLIAKKFILVFDSGVIVIKHWLIHNYIRNDRYKETVYTEEKQMLAIKENKAYTFKKYDAEIPDDNQRYTIGIPDDNQPVYQMETQVRLGKDRDRIGKKEFIYMPQAQKSEDEPVDNFEEYNESDSPADDAGKRIDMLREYWNDKGLVPMRLNVFNFTDIDRQNCMGIVSFYSDDEIKNAIDNYSQILNDKEHYSIPFPYQSFTGFMGKGVEKFFRDANPFEKYMRRENMTPQKSPGQDLSKYAKYDKMAEEYRKRCGFEE